MNRLQVGVPPRWHGSVLGLALVLMAACAGQPSRPPVATRSAPAPAAAATQAPLVEWQKLVTVPGQPQPYVMPVIQEEGVPIGA